MQTVQKISFFFFCLILLVSFLLLPGESFCFFGGAGAEQTRTIGGKNPLKERQYRRGNPRTRLYHNSSSPAFKSKQCTILFKTADEAKLSGFRPCGRCGG